MTQSNKTSENIEDIEEMEVNSIKQRADRSCQIDLLSPVR